MDWVSAAIPYLLVGIGLAEGANWARRRARQPFKGGAYLIVVLLWPVILLMSLARSR